MGAQAGDGLAKVEGSSVIEAEPKLAKSFFSCIPR
jgi:hypothetical protein